MTDSNGDAFGFGNGLAHGACMLPRCFCSLFGLLLSNDPEAQVRIFCMPSVR